MAYVYGFKKKDDRLEKLEKMQDMEGKIETLTDELEDKDRIIKEMTQESKEYHEKIERLLEERNEEISDLKYKLSQNKSRYSESLRRIENRLEQRDREISSLRSDLSETKRQYREKEWEMSNMRDRVRSTQKFGGTVEVYCPGCGGYHTIPYMPGEYAMCSWWVVITNDGKIKTISGL